MIIRAARADDLQEFRDLRLTALKTAPTAFGSAYEQALTLSDSHWLERMVSDSHHCLHIAVDGSDVVGMTGVFRETSPKRQHYATIWGVFVREEYRGQRIAEKLVKACLDWARMHEATHARLSVNASNIRAINCYMRCGFRVYGVEPAGLLWEGTYYDELWMMRELNP